MKTFNDDKFRDKASTLIENLMKDVPPEWKADMASFLSVQAVIFGANNMFEGVGILEFSKQEYINVCEEVIGEENETTTGLN